MRAPTRRPARWAARAGAIAVTTLLATLAIWAFPVGSVAAAPPTLGAAPGTPPVPWAYGNLTTQNVTWPAMHGMYEGYATYGFSVVLIQTNTTATTYSLSENQTVGALINLTYCRPNCEAPSVTEQYSYRAWETWNEVTNFTTAVSVTLHDGSPIGAVGIAGSDASSAANITEKLTTDHTGSVRLVDQLFASASTRFSLDFAPALGLFPLNLTLGSSWIASATFTAVGSWESGYLSLNAHGPTGSSQTSGNLSGTGIATLEGTDRGPLLLADQGLTQVEMRLAVVPTLGSAGFRAGFELMDGFAILPNVANLLRSPSTAGWASRAMGNTTATTSLADLGPRSGSGPERFIASAWSYSTAISAPDPSSSGNSSTVQGAPLTPAQASSTSNCLEGTVACGTTGSNPTTPTFGGNELLPIAFLGIGTVAIAVVVGGLLIARRRRIPPPIYPNAALYPPGGSGARTDAPAESTGPAPPPEEDDPLQNLW